MSKQENGSAAVAAPLEQAAKSITVDKGIPLPDSHLRGRYAPLPFGTMEVGDSFVYPAHPAGLDRTRHSAANATNRAGTDQKKFAQRTVTENGVKVVRVWRTA